MTARPPHDVSLDFEYDDQHRARLVGRSIRPEIGEIDDERSQTTLTRDGGTLSVHIEAEDLVALRAAMNTWLTLLDVAETVGYEDGPRTSSE